MALSEDLERHTRQGTATDDSLLTGGATVTYVDGKGHETAGSSADGAGAGIRGTSLNPDRFTLLRRSPARSR